MQEKIMASEVRYCQVCESNILHDKEKVVLNHSKSNNSLFSFLRPAFAVMSFGLSEIMPGVSYKIWVCQKCKTESEV
jgi:hypothetical protein